MQKKLFQTALMAACLIAGTAFESVQAEELQKCRECVAFQLNRTDLSTPLNCREAVRFCEHYTPSCQTTTQPLEEIKQKVCGC